MFEDLFGNIFNMKEKDIENAIYRYLLSIGAWVEKLQWGKVLIKKWAYQHMMTLQSSWAPDIACFFKGQFYWIEVKKDEDQTNKWIVLEDRFKNTWELPKSYSRELNQIKHKHKIIDNWWVHIITHDLQEVKDYFNKL